MSNYGKWGRFYPITEEYLNNGIMSKKESYSDKILENHKNMVANMGKEEPKLCIKTLEKVMVEIERITPHNGPDEYTHGLIQAYTLKYYSRAAACDPGAICKRIRI